MRIERRLLRLNVLSRPGAFTRTVGSRAVGTVARRRLIARLKIQCPGVARRMRAGSRRACLVVLSGGRAAVRQGIAQGVADHLGRPLQVVSGYIGETEKNIDRLLVAAGRHGVILYFDEADALFGKRTDVRDGHDRYANAPVSYLAGRAEAHSGIVILSTNLPAGRLSDANRRRTIIVDVARSMGDED